MFAADYISAPPGDFVLPFDLPEAGVRGRLVRLDASSSRALDHHDLPEAAGRVAGEALALVVLLGSLLKLDGKLTVQLQAKGPLDLAVADYYGASETDPRGLRGYARADAESIAALGRQPSFAALTGEGSLAITVRPRIEDKQYQGVVALVSDGVAASAENYFRQSEQLDTMVRLTAAQFVMPMQVPSWRAGGLLLQVTPGAKRDPDDWNRLTMLASTVEAVELVDTGLAAETLLWRLFNQEEVRLLPVEPISFRCDCNLESIRAVLQSYPHESRTDLADPDGVIRAKCEFCGAVHAIEI
jgi:molecular chaperone Hsp33